MQLEQALIASSMANDKHKFNNNVLEGSFGNTPGMNRLNYYSENYVDSRIYYIRQQPIYHHTPLAISYQG